MFNEFREFIARGNVIDLATGIIIGTAFTAVVNSLVADILMPPIGLIIGGVDFSELYFTLSAGDYASLAEAQAAGAATLNIGVFLNAVIRFLIVGFAVFILVKQVNRLRRRQVEEPAQAPDPPRQEMLLAEIRDLLKAGHDPEAGRRG